MEHGVEVVAVMAAVTGGGSGVRSDALFGIGGNHPSHEFAWSSWSSRAWRCEKTALNEIPNPPYHWHQSG
jgi:hypothetical protein